MKSFLVSFFLIVILNNLFADCSSKGMSFYPQQKEISLNSMFIIQGYASSQETILSFKNRNVYLKSENGEKVILQLIRILVGQMNLTEAIFKTEKELSPFTTYYLNYENQTKNEKDDMYRRTEEIFGKEDIYWITTDKKFNPNINLKVTLSYEDTEITYYGCGPSAYANFNILNLSNTKIWYKTELLEITSNKTTTYYIQAWNDQLSVGHGMCSSAFRFEKEGEYKVRFTPLNLDGKESETTDWFTFESPYLKNLEFPILKE